MFTKRMKIYSALIKNGVYRPGCPARVDVRCNHHAATLFAIEDKQNNEVFTGAANTAGAVSHQETNVLRTSMPMEFTEKKKNKCRTHTVFEVSKTRIC